MVNADTLRLRLLSSLVALMVSGLQVGSIYIYARACVAAGRVSGLWMDPAPMRTATWLDLSGHLAALSLRQAFTEAGGHPLARLSVCGRAAPEDEVDPLATAYRVGAVPMVAAV